MKKSITFLICVSLVIPAIIAQETDASNNEFKTLFGDRKVSHGGYGGLTINYSQIDSKDAIIVGARAAWVIGHGFALGFAGSGFINDYSWNPVIAGGRNVNLTGGYGGLLMEPILFPRFPVHISIPIMIGAGGIAYTSTFNPYPYEYDESFDLFVEDATGYLMINPGIELEFNVVRFFRLAVGGYYRYTSKIQLYDTPEDVLNGWSAGITLKFGKF
ncbi:hypothetical protein ACFLTU_02355 [Bacteroidota bacterium]